MVVEVFEPVGEVEFARGEVAGGDEVEDDFLELDVEVGEPVTGAGAGDGFELVEAEPVVECDGWRAQDEASLELVTMAASRRDAT